MTKTPTPPVHLRRDAFDPDPELARLRDREPVAHIESPGALPFGPTPTWLVTGSQEVREVLSDAERFSSEMLRPIQVAIAGDGTQPLTRDLIASDPPDHTRLRRMLTPEFTMKRMRHLKPRIETIVADHLDAMEQAGPPVDLVEAFALPVPSLVICELLGVPYADRAQFQLRSNERLDMSKPLQEQMAIVAESRVYIAGLVARQRAEPDEGMLGMLVREHGDELTDDELVSLGDLLLLAGHETTANMLGVGTALLLDHPDQLALLRDHPEHTDTAVEELLRHLSIVQALVRTARTDVVLGGRRIKAGEALLCSLPAANRDDAHGPGMDTLDLTRAPVPHVAFGHGVHFCLGAALARMEMRIAFPALLRRFPALRPDVPAEQVRFSTFGIIFSTPSLPVAW